MIANVLIEIKTSNNPIFSYLIPSELKNIKIGSRVLVPFSKKEIEGFVISISNKLDTSFEIKNIIKVLDDNPVLNSELIELGKYMSKKTLTPLISCYQTMLPSALKAKHKTKINKKYVSFVSLNVDYNEAINKVKNEGQKKIIETLKDNEFLKKDISKISESSLKTLIKSNIVKEEEKEEYRLNINLNKEENNVILNEDQQYAVNTVLKSKNIFKPYLLYGVTGSGKTEVYMHVIEEVIKEKKEVIVLVPEISLTPQLIQNFTSRFGSNIAVLHSGLSQGEKYDEWRKIERKEVSIVVGARSAIFAPFENIGLIVIDEEHSSTYKQDNSPRYNAIDMAIVRAKKNKCPIILGSATPQIESYTRAMSNIYELLELKNRINKSLPDVTLIDMKDEIRKGNRIISELLKNKIEEKLEKNEQVILLLNRRGYTTITTCKNCGYVHKCPNCDIPLTYHKTSNTYRCHYCGYGTAMLLKCPECGNTDLGAMGLGTEKLEQYIKENIKGSKTIRMDVDTTTSKGSHERIINSFKNQEYNVLIGTQMISKGLDFKKVTLVGVINGDASLNIPDFRSSERTFQLLNQVAGRAGRASLKGEVIIQGFNCNHYSIVLASQNDYKKFYEKELQIRKKLNYPPYYNMCIIRIKSTTENELFKEGNKIVSYLNNCKMKDTFILGPSTCSIYKINNVYSIQILIKYKHSEELFKKLEFINDMYQNKKIKVEIDINPIKI